MTTNRFAPCAQCGRPGLRGFEENGVQYNLCLEHARMAEDMRNRDLASLQVMAERAEDDIADIVGMPRKVRSPHGPQSVNVHQVVNMRDNYGVVSAGVVDTISHSIDTIGRHGDGELAGALAMLMQGVLRSPELSDVQKQEAADLLNVVTSDIALPTPQRAPQVVMRAVASGLGDVLSNAANLATLWSAIEPLLKV